MIKPANRETVCVYVVRNLPRNAIAADLFPRCAHVESICFLEVKE